MCILFAYVSGPAGRRNNSSKKYLKFALAFNRDEFYYRPSVPAHFWESDPNILAGQDKESGGTWLGLNKKTGRLAALTNIMGGTVKDRVKVSRGALITDFLRSESNINGRTYSTNLHQDPAIFDKFNKFNLLTIDLSLDKNNNSTQSVDRSSIHLPWITYLTNATKSPPLFIHPNSTSQEHYYFGVSNSVWDKPFSKVINGSKAFGGIVNRTVLQGQEDWSQKCKDSLCKQVLGLLKSKHKHFPDAQMEGQAYEHMKPHAHYFSSNFVSLPPTQYGTRTHTLIFLDSEDYVDFYEWTMKEPINTTEDDPTWTESKFSFQLFS